jgi:enoyl-CoA hydratase
MWMICTGSPIDAQRAFQIGLVQELVPAGQALSGTLELAHAIAGLPQPALVADRRGVVASTGQALEVGLDSEARVGRAVMRDPSVIQRDPAPHRVPATPRALSSQRSAGAER